MDRPTFFPVGTRVLGPRIEYRIRILYREPGYARQSDHQMRDYRWTYNIVASDLGQAKAMAEAEFRKIARLSSVGWAREITEIVVVD